MNKPFFSLFLAILATIRFVFPALAAGGCIVNTGVGGSVPYETTIEVTGTEGPTLIQFGDRSPDFVGRTADHTYHAVSAFRVTAIVDGNDGTLYRCHAYVTTLPYNGRDLEYSPTDLNYAPTAIPVEAAGIYPSDVETNDSFNDNSVSLDTDMGDGNNAPVINGNENSVTIEGDETTLKYNITNITVERPESVIEAKVVAEPAKIQKTNAFTAIVHALLRGNEAFFHILDESWFPYVPAE